MMFLFGNSGGSGSGSGSGSRGKKGDPAELAKEWKRNLQKEMRRMDRDIANIKRAEDKSVKEAKALAKAGRISAVKILAKEIAATRKAVERMYTAKAQMNSVANSLQTSMSMMKLQGTMAKSAEIMTAMNNLVNIKEIRETMTSMAREMEKTGLVDEIIGDTLDSMDEGLETEADKEAERIVAELTADILAPAGAVPQGPIKKPSAVEEVQEEEVKPDPATADLMARLQSL